ncbi:hypothetical protein YWIDRAFT_04633 [Streptomyces sp. SceaMP-e96]|uniref:hypothetical protein n=1 Tax=Streptomyces TaxID=1883 RepID=UPI000823D329|nr:MULTISPECIES: hypothetical protein [unclassified Streptomyces]SCK19759.1 hypothetical protein YWIDRAFT_04633 [Streptomyces sp. SceaMP-e96]
MTEERERIRQQLIADPRAVATIVAAVREQVPAYAALDDSRLHEVRAIAAWALDRLLHLWVTDGALTPADLRRFRGIAAARAADGRPMPAVLRAYRVAATVRGSRLVLLLPAAAGGRAPEVLHERGLRWVAASSMPSGLGPLRR